MSDFFVEVGEEVAVSVFRNGQSAGAIIMKRTHKHMIETDVYCNDGQERAFLAEAMSQGLAALQFTFEKAKMQKELKARIRELRDADREGSEGEPPSPTDDLGDIPF